MMPVSVKELLSCWRGGYRKHNICWRCGKLSHFAYYEVFGECKVKVP